MTQIVSKTNFIDFAAEALVVLEEEKGINLFNEQGQLNIHMLILFNSRSSTNQLIVDFPEQEDFMKVFALNSYILDNFASPDMNYIELWQQQLLSCYSYFYGDKVKDLDNNANAAAYLSALLSNTYSGNHVEEVFPGLLAHEKNILNNLLEAGIPMENYTVLEALAVFWENESVRSRFQPVYKEHKEYRFLYRKKLTPEEEATPYLVTEKNPSVLEKPCKSFIDFKPAAVPGPNTGYVQYAGQEMFDGEWGFLQQSNDSFFSWGGASGCNGYMAHTMTLWDDNEKESLFRYHKVLKEFALAIAEFTAKDYDEILYNNGEPVALKGWRLERLYRVQSYGKSEANTIYMDYCLGMDGHLYLVISDDRHDLKTSIMMECLLYHPFFMKYKKGNMLFGAMGATIGLLDAIPMDENDPSRRVVLNIPNGNSFFYNFPYGIANVKTLPYAMWQGLVIRLANLLTIEQKLDCVSKYPWTFDLL